MKKAPLRTTRTLLMMIAGSFPVLLQAQGEEANVRLAATTVSGPVGNVGFMNGSKAEFLEVYEGSRSKQVRYAGPPTISFFRTDPEDAGGGGDSGRQAIGSVQLPALSGDFLLLFARKQGTEYEYEVTPISEKMFYSKPGMFRFINVSPSDVVVKLGDQDRLVKTSGYGDFNMSSSDDEFHEVTVFSIVENGKPLRAFSGSLSNTGEHRFIYLIRGEAGGRAGRISLVPVAENVSGR